MDGMTIHPLPANNPLRYLISHVPQRWWDKVLDTSLRYINLDSSPLFRDEALVRTYCYRRAAQRGLKVKVNHDRYHGRFYIQAYAEGHYDPWPRIQAQPAPPVPPDPRDPNAPPEEGYVPVPQVFAVPYPGGRRPRIGPPQGQPRGYITQRQLDVLADDMLNCLLQGGYVIKRDPTVRIAAQIREHEQRSWQQRNGPQPDEDLGPVDPDILAWEQERCDCGTVDGKHPASCAAWG